MKYLSLDEAIILHNDIMEAMNGLQGYNKSRISYLESALTHIQNDEFYPSFLDKLTHLIFSCVEFHPLPLYCPFGWQQTHCYLYCRCLYRAKSPRDFKRRFV